VDWEALDTSQDEIARKLFGDLNRGLLGNGKVIVMSDSDEEEHGDDCANADATPSSLRVRPAPLALWYPFRTVIGVLFNPNE
jgi:hypothetical protein